ncbi:prophage endopeptidase tail family protein [Planococcus sp. SE5232]|uniref:prophage endopeptidase tail family protein n=1 Tax=unclassified Planococcus (in: firmicutes) TaxID=2662419 RepID=UPI003D6B02C8
MISITDIGGEVHLLNGIKQINRAKKVNGEKTLSFVVVPTESNKHAFDVVINESLIKFENENYVIKKTQEKNVGNTYIKSVEAVHVFFNDMINSFQYNLHNGSQTFFAALTRVFEPTPYSFSIVDSFTAETFENFGRDNCLSLFKNVLERYEAEFEVIGYQVYLKRKIGADTGFQLRWKSNIKAIDKEVDTQGLSTVIKGFGGTPSEAGVYPIQREYRSNVEFFGEKHAAAVYDEATSTAAGMDARLRRELIDEPQLSITVDIAAVEGEVKNEGDRGFIVYEPMKITVEARVVELTETFEYINRRWRAVKTAVTLSNFRNRLTDVLTRFGQTTKRVDRLFDGNEKLPYNVLPEAMRIAAEAINNSLTEIKYPPNQGIVLQDPNNPSRMVRLTSAGIGLSDDGGTSYRTAMTGAGIVTNELVAGVIRTNNIQIIGNDDLFYWDGQGLFAYNPNDLNKFVRLNSSGLYIARGAFSMERPDGYVAVENGLSKADYAITGTIPPYTSTAIQISGVFMRTRSTVPVSMDYISFRHESRYLKLRVAQFSEIAGSHSMFSVEPVGGQSPLLTYNTLNSNSQGDEANNGVTLTVDLGVPTGNTVSLYLRMRSGNSESYAHARILRMWKEG